MASQLLMEISQDERERAHLRSRRMFETDMTSNILTAESRGRKEGQKEGRKEGRLKERQKNVRHMYQEGFDVKTIAKALGLSEQDVKDILDSKAR